MSLAAARVLRPDWPRGLIARRVPKDWPTVLAALGCTSLHVGSRRLDRRSVARIKQSGYLVAVFTVNQKRRAGQLMQWGVDCLITDAPDRIATALASARNAG
jgi:glycerophosphoryl diester phosphodiesterase